jgi:hypothetical protein
VKKKKIVYSTGDLIGSGEEYLKLSKEEQKARLELLLSCSDTADDIFRLRAFFMGGIYEGPFHR